MQGQGDSLTTTGVARPILSGRFSAMQRVKLPRTCQAHAHQKSGSDLCDRRFCDCDGLLRSSSDVTDGSEAEQVLRRRQNIIKFIPARHEEAAAFIARGYAKQTGSLGGRRANHRSGAGCGTSLPVLIKRLAWSTSPVSDQPAFVILRERASERRVQCSRSAPPHITGPGS